MDYKSIKSISKYITLEIFIFLMIFLMPTEVFAAQVGDTKNFDYKNSIQEFIAPATGYYQLEVWGAQGGTAYSGYTGGYGGYSTGVVFLNKDQRIYIGVGGQGIATGGGKNVTVAGGYNGGGGAKNYASESGRYTASGGGATHISINNNRGVLSNYNSYRNEVLIVAGGGAGTAYYSSSYRSTTTGHAGGYIGVEGAGVGGTGGQKRYASGGTQTGPGSKYAIIAGFGYGATSYGSAPGGGGGWYGGNEQTWAAGGGSGYIGNSLLLSRNGVTKTMYCYGCSTSTSSSTKTSSTSSISSNAITGYAKSGNGYAKVTIKELVNTNSKLNNISVSGGTFFPNFSPEIYNYDVVVDSDNYNVNVTATPQEATTTVVGTGNYIINVGGNKISLTTTADSGDISIYTLNISRTASNYKYLSDIKIDNKSIPNFAPEKLEYNIEVDYGVESINLQAISGRPNQTINVPSDYSLKTGNNEFEIEVISENLNDSSVYKINVFRKHSSKLKSLDLGKYSIDFDPDTLTYTLNIMKSTMSIPVVATPYDEEAKVSLSGFGYIKNSTVGTITVSEPNSSPTEYKINIIKDGNGETQVYNFPYNGGIQEFIASATGYYQLEAWGAQGGTAYSKYTGGYGGYSTGVVFLNKDQRIYIGVGGKGIATGSGRNVTVAGGYNGGGGAKNYASAAGRYTSSGGGATHISINNNRGVLSNYNSYRDEVLIVAGGGAGTAYFSSLYRSTTTGHAGGYIGVEGTGVGGTGGQKRYASGGTQTGPGSKYAIIAGFGYGATSTGSSPGGGGGWYGGNIQTWAAGGGSGYIGNPLLTSYKSTTKVMYCYSCSKSDNENIYTVSTSNYSSSPISYYAKSGDGYARITMLAQASENNFLSEIKTDKGSLNPTYDMTTLNYDVELDSEDDEITIGAKPEDATAVIIGTGTFDVPAGDTTFPIMVTAESGDIRIYNVTVHREASSNSKPIDIIISGLVPSLCSINSKYCSLDREFDPEVHSYTLTVPSRIKQLEFTVLKGHKYQTVNGEGVINLEGGMNVITIEVISEDGSSTTTYTYNIDRDMTGNAYIEELKVVDPKVDINFDPDITDYYFSIPNSYTDVELEVTLEDPKATYKVIGNENFVVGLNLVIIEVTAQNGETQTYTLNIYREQNGNTFLSSLEVSNNTTVFPINPTFNKIISNYTVNVGNEIEEVEIKATAEHSLTTISGLGKKALKTGTNTYKITSTAEDGSVQIYTVSIIRAKNTDATLKTLDVLESSLNPTFASNTFEYNLEVNPGITSLNMNIVPNNSSSTYKVSGNSGFKVGEGNTVKIVVTAEAGNTNTYIIHVNRKPSTNTYLKYLATDEAELVPIFDKNTSEYDVTVENDVSQIVIFAEAADPLSTIMGVGKFSLKTGLNEFEIMVTAEDGSTRAYTLHITRKQNSNANLLSLNTSSKETLMPEFNASEQNYNLYVENEEDKITVIGVAEAKTSVVSGNGEYALSVGNTTITLKVTAEDGTTKDYTLIVNRKPSSNANATSIIAKESVLDPKFDKNIENYVLKVIESVTHLTLKITLEDPTATYEVIGNENFIIGNNKVFVKVTAEDGTIKTYELNVLRQAAGTTSNRLEWLHVDKGTLSPNYSKDINYYEVEVPYNVSDITLTGELEDKNATVTGLSTYHLNVGQNILAVEVTSVEGVVRYYQVVVTRKENDEARLASLQVVGANLTPNFNKDTYIYSLNTSQTNLVILANPIDVNATVEIIGGSNLSLGANTVTIKVTAENGVTTKNYVININKEKSSNNNLKSLTIEDKKYTPDFSKTTTVYYLDVERDQETIQIEAIPEDINATVTGDGEVSLSVGVNYVEIVVESENGTPKVYTVIITRKGNNNNYLANLTVSKGSLSPEFIKTTSDYKVTVDYETEEITLSGFAEDPSATVIGLEKYELEVGENKLVVTVQAEDGTVRFYNVVVEREKIVSSQLEDLQIKNYELSMPFNKDVYDYNVVIDNEVNSLDITAIPIDKDATYEIVGNENFIVGMNTVEIIVTDRLGNNSSTYTLNVNKQSYSNTYLLYIYPNKGTLIPEFDKTNLTYTVEVESDVNSINIAAEPEITTNTLTGTGDYTLNNNSTKVPLVVTTPTGITRTYYVNVVKKLKENNSLESLTVKANGETKDLTPVFDKDTLDYSVTVEPGTSNISISATAEEGATIFGVGNKSLKKGENTFDIVVKAENGNSKTYHLTVNRPASTNNFLIDLIPSAGNLEPSFSYTENEYSIKLDSSVSLLSFEAITEDINARVTGLDREVVPDGHSTRTITVEAEDGSKKAYTINVYKDRTDEARLESLSINGYTLNEIFDKDKFNYTLTVPNNKSVLLSNDVEAIPLDKNAKVTKTSSLVLSSNLTNIYTIVVTAKDGFTTETYTIAIDREKGTDSTLAKLSFKNGELSPTFIPSVKEYTLTLSGVSSIDEIEVEAIPTDRDASVFLPPAFDLNNGDTTYEIVVESPDKSSTTTYTVHVDRLESNDTSLKVLESDIGTFSPAFSKDVRNYTLNILDNVNEVNITALPNDEKATIISGTGNTQITGDTETIDVSVQAEDGSIGIYSIIVKKSLTTKTDLSDLYLGRDCTKETCPLTPTFNKTNYTYTATVENDKKNIDIIFEKMHISQKIKVYNETTNSLISSENIELLVGNNNFRIEVENDVGGSSNYTLEITRKKSSNNYLKSLSITNADVEIDFKKEQFEYDVTIPNELSEVLLEYEPEDPKATVVTSGTTYLNIGNNDVLITVTAEDLSTRTYIIHVVREGIENPYLQSLTVSSGNIYTLTPKFKKTVASYSVDVPAEVEKITLDAVAEDKTTTVAGTGEHDIKTGINKFLITTTTQNGTTMVYTVLVNRLKSTRLFLKELTPQVSTLNEQFIKNKFSYTMTVNSTVTDLDFKVVPELSTTTYQIIGNKKLVSGKNTVLIVLSNSDKTLTTTYKVEVNKEKSSDNYLSSLTVNGNELINSINKENTIFNITIPHNADIADIVAIPNVSTSTATGDGKYSLDYGNNVINIKVTAEDLSTRDYIINIKREYDLSLLMISTDRGDLTPSFNPDILEYTLDVEKEIEDINILAVTNSVLTSVTGNGYHTLNIGNNLIPLVVSSSDGSTRTYNISINRKKSSNNYIKNLFVHEGYMLEEFSKENTEYNLEVPNNISRLTMDIELEDTSASYVVEGNESLKLGDNTIKIIVTAEDGSLRVYTLSVLVEEASEFSNRLLDIKVNKGTLAPIFSPDTTTYTVTVPEVTKDITVSGIVESVEATAEGFGTYNLVSGRNEIQIVVTSKDKKKRTYSIIVYKIQSSDARLKSVKFKEGNFSPLFDKDVENYKMTINSSITSLTEEVEPLVEGTTYKINGNHDLKTGITTVTIVATAEDKITEKTYTFTVEKEISKNNYLASLASNIGVISPEFNKTNTGPYTIDVDETVNSLVLTGKAEDAKAIVSGLGLHQINKGKNTIPITVTSESNEIRTYTLIVNKSLSSDNDLAFLGVSDGNLEPEFNPNTTEYKLNLDNEVSELTVLGLAKDKNATVSGNGVYNIGNDGNQIKILVTAENGDVKTYIIDVTKKELISSKLLDIKAHEGRLTPEFNKNGFNYMIKVPYEVTSLTLDIIKEDETATYEVLGNENFIIGTNQVEVIVTAKDGTTSTYILNVLRQSASNNYLKELNISEGILSPKFEKTTIYYEVEVPSTVTSIDVSGVAEDINSTVTGNNNYSLETGANYIYIDVTSDSGMLRTYTVKVIRKESTVNSLLSLSVDQGSLSPEFNPDINHYVVDLLEGINNIEIFATSDPKSIVTGTGKKTLVNGENRFEIVVTAENGDVNTYEIIINKTSSSNNNILNIIPSSGTLDPNYVNGIDTYEVIVEEDVVTIDFDVVTESELATVTGDKNNYLDYGQNSITIVVEAEDGSKKEVYINVIREKNITSIEVDKEELLIEKGDTVEVVASILPEDATNKEVEWKTDDPLIATVDDGIITGINYGTVDITVYSIKNPNVKKVVTVTVINLHITSNDYEVRRDDEIYPYIIGAEQGELLNDFVSHLENNPSMLHFYSTDNIEFTNLENEKVKTGTLITLEYNDVKYDEVYIAVRGDNDGDGEINIKDYNIAVSHILKKQLLENYWFVVTNVDEEIVGIINVKDSNKIQNKILKKVASLNS